MLSVMKKFSGLYNWYVLVVLTLGYLTAELGHFLVGVTSKDTSREVPYGDIACILNKTEPEYNYSLALQCESATNMSSCHGLVDSEGVPFCEWDRNGLGIEYQILAGPSFIAVYTIAGIFLGISADKYTRVTQLSVCVFITGASIVLFGATKSYWQLIALRMIFAAGEAGLNPLSTGLLSDIFPEELRGLVMSIFNWGIYGGIGLSFPVGRYFTMLNAWDLGWRLPYYLSGGFALVVGVLSVTTLKEPKRMMIGEEKAETKVVEKTNSDGTVVVVTKEAKKENPWKFLVSPRFLMLCLAASIRHTGGLCFAYNCDQFYRVVFPHIDLGGWLFFTTFVVGGIGVLGGGWVSDKAVGTMGVKSRVICLALSQLISTPFAFGSIYLGPVGAMVTLAISYLFAEMWFGILFAVLVEIVPLSVRSTTVGVFLFIMNNIGGNLPILMEPVRKMTSFQDSLAIFYAGAYLVSSVLFGLTALTMGSNKKSDPEAKEVNGVDNKAYATTEQNDKSSQIIESHHL